MDISLDTKNKETEIYDKSHQGTEMFSARSRNKNDEFKNMFEQKRVPSKSHHYKREPQG